MFVQVFLLFVSVFLIYLGITEKSLIDIVLGMTGILSVCGFIYAAKSGSSFIEEFYKWKGKHNRNAS